MEEVTRNKECSFQRVSDSEDRDRRFPVLAWALVFSAPRLNLDVLLLQMWLGKTGLSLVGA